MFIAFEMLALTLTLVTPNLEFVPGYTYVFDVSHSTNAGHPLYITSLEHTVSNGFDMASTLRSRRSCSFNCN